MTTFVFQSIFDLGWDKSYLFVSCTWKLHGLKCACIGQNELLLVMYAHIRFGHCPYHSYLIVYPSLYFNNYFLKIASLLVTLAENIL